MERVWLSWAGLFRDGLKAFLLAGVGELGLKKVSPRSFRAPAFQPIKLGSRWNTLREIVTWASKQISWFWAGSFLATSIGAGCLLATSVGAGCLLATSIGAGCLLAISIGAATEVLG